MRYNVCLLISLLATSSLFAQKTVQMSAVRANDYGVAYSLPKTTVEVKVKYTKITKEAGEFYQFSERYLNLNNPFEENTVEYEIDKIEAKTKGIVDKSRSYLVEFKDKTVAPYLTLTADGILCAINSDYTFPSAKKELVNKKEKAKDAIPASAYLSEEILRAGSTAKQAELIAKQIYKLRESRTNILTGDADNMPPDGESYKLVMSQLDEQEQALTAMFVGTEKKEMLEASFTIEPQEADLENYIVFRFSKKLGVVDRDDLAGAPILLKLKRKEPKTETILTDKDLKDLEKKFSRGIIYNIPEKANMSIQYEGETYVDEVCEVVQYGEQEVLEQRMFENNKAPIKVIFTPETGRIKQIIQ